MEYLGSLTRIGLLVAGLLVAGSSAEAASTTRYVQDSAGSRVIVEGTSTLHGWRAEGALVGALVLTDSDLSGLWSISGDVREVAATARVDIPVTSLTSGNDGLDQNMYRALQAGTHPAIRYRLTAAQIAGAPDSDRLTVEATGMLTVAGVERPISLVVALERLPNDRFQVTGQTTLRMTDFNIKPPKAMLGMIRSGDEVQVSWSWFLVRE